jgi:cytochrome c
MRHGAKMVAVLALALAGCGGSNEPAGEGSGASVSAAARPPAAFAQCMACHSVEPGRTMIGPSLHGVVGRKAASLPGFAYSPALKASGLTWDEATLDKWIEAPARLVPGTRMTYAGMPDAASRKALIAWLAAQK